MLELAKTGMRRGFRAAIRLRPLRKAINHATIDMPWQIRRKLHSGFSFSLDGGVPGWKDDIWRVRFAGKTVIAPLRASDLAMDWTCAMALVGHDVKEKQTYAALLASEYRPDVFLDVGGNYGLHSLLMMTHGVKAVYFEPNSSCHGYFAAAAAVNGLTPRVEPVALGAEGGTITLSYPKTETWLGSINDAVVNALGRENMVSEVVPMRTLDSYVEDLPPGKMLLKIDAEGSELAILSSAGRLLAERRPIIAFESHIASGERQALRALLDRSGYDVMFQPWPQAALSVADFETTGEYNFVGVPR